MAAYGRRRGLLRLCLAGVLLAIGFGYISPAYNYYTRTVEIEKEKIVYAGLQDRNRQLLLEKEGLEDGTRVESVAREELGLVKPGEQPYIVKDIESQAPEAVAPATPPETAPPAEAGRNNFLSRLFTDH